MYTYNKQQQIEFLSEEKKKFSRKLDKPKQDLDKVLRELI